MCDLITDITKDFANYLYDPGYGRAPLPYARPLGAFGSYGVPLGNPYGPGLGGPLGGFGGAPYGAPLGGFGGAGYGAPANYQFGYGVQTDDYYGAAAFGHNEERNAYGTVGHYHVNTPGSYQSVSYNVGGH